MVQRIVNGIVVSVVVYIAVNYTIAAVTGCENDVTVGIKNRKDQLREWISKKN